MARYKTDIEEGIGIEIYNRYVKVCTEEKSIPDPYVFWKVFLVGRDKYPISKGGFSHWLNRLQIPSRPGDIPYVWRDPKTRAWRLKDVDVRKLNS